MRAVLPAAVLLLLTSCAPAAPPQAVPTYVPVPVAPPHHYVRAHRKQKSAAPEGAVEVEGGNADAATIYDLQTRVWALERILHKHHPRDAGAGQ